MSLIKALAVSVVIIAIILIIIGLAEFFTDFDRINSHDSEE